MQSLYDSGQVIVSVLRRVAACVVVVAAVFVVGVGVAGAASTGVYPYAVFDGESLTDRSSIGVNVVNGNLLVSASDLEIAGTGLDLVVDRSYNGLSQVSGSLGSRWSMGTGQDVRLFDGGSSVQVYGSTGEVLSFASRGDGTYDSPPGAHASLFRDSDLVAGCDWWLEPDCWRQSFRLMDHASGGRLLFTSSGAGGWERLEGQASAQFNWISYHYTGAGKLSSIVDTQGRTVTVARDGAERIARLTDVSGRSVVYAYDGAGRLETVTDGAGGVTRYGYDGAGRLASITTPAGGVTRVTYTTQDRVATVVRTTDAARTTGPTTTFTYGTGAPCATGQPRTVVGDPLAPSAAGHTVTYCGDTLGRVVKSVDSAGGASTATYNATGDVASVTSPGGGVTNYGYDAQKRTLACVQRAVTQVQACLGSSGGLRTTIEYANTDELTRYFPTKITNPQGYSETFCYNGASPNCGYSGSVGTLYSRTNSLSAQSTWRYSYDSKGNVTAQTDARGNVTTYGYDTVGNLRSVTPPASAGTRVGAWTFTHDALSRPKTITDGKGVTETRGYDALDRATSMVFSGGPSFGYEFDGDGVQRRLIDADGSLTTTTPDAIGRVQREDSPDGFNVYGYDAASNLRTITDQDGVTTYTYNGLNRLASVTEPGDATPTTFDYNADGDRTRMRYPSGVTVDWAYDVPSGRVTSVTNSSPSGAVLKRFSYTYVKAGRDTELAQTITDQAGNITTKTFDALDRPIEAVTTGPNPSREQYMLDGNGNRLRQTINEWGTSGGETTDWAYDSASLPCWRTEWPGTAQQAGPFTCEDRPDTGGPSPTEFFHDANANQTANGHIEVDYNAARQPTRVFTNAFPQTPNTVRFRGADQSQVVREGTAVIRHNQLGMSARGPDRYTHATDGTVISQRSTLSATRRRNYLYDGLGSVVGLTDQNGALKTSYTYDAYGHPPNDLPIGDNNPFASYGDMVLSLPLGGIACNTGATAGASGSGSAAAAGRGVRAAGQELRDAAEGRAIQLNPATKAGEEGLDGASRTYINITKGKSVRNIGTDATRNEFADTLTKGGWAARTSKDGAVQVFSKDGAEYVLREKNSSRYPGWTADYTPLGAKGHTLEIRLGYKP